MPHPPPHRADGDPSMPRLQKLETIIATLDEVVQLDDIADVSDEDNEN